MYKRIVIELSDLQIQRNLVSDELLAVVTAGCNQTLKRLDKKFQKAVKVFRIAFISFNGSPIPGPLVKVCYRDRLGREHSYPIDYRNIGSGKKNPKAEEIADALCKEDSLPADISKHFEDRE